MPTIYEFRHTVLPDEIDGQGHVNNLEYLKWMQSAAVAHSDSQGWTAERYQETAAGWVVRSHTIEYLRPAFAGDDIVVHTWVSNFRKITSLRKYKITNAGDGTTLSVAQTDWVYVGLKHQVPRRIPPELSESFTILAAEDEP